MEKPFHIFNTLSRSVEEFRPLNPPTVTLYSCGPTVYLPQHLGNMRAFLFVDTLKRALEFNGYHVRHLMNITDVGHMTSDQDAGEDKVEKTARAQGKTPREVADFYIRQFQGDFGRLNIKPPNAYWRATEHIAEMQTLVGRIIERGYAYVTPSAVYFDVEKWRGPSRVGRLSRQSLEEQYAGQRLEHSPDKKSPHDFALWVLNQPHHLMQWESPWGRGYPGWHIECSAMSMRHLGESFDIHTGGVDLVFPHHEDEIAQSAPIVGGPPARIWVHGEFLQVGGQKMAKSAGNIERVADLADRGVDGDGGCRLPVGQSGHGGGRRRRSGRRSSASKLLVLSWCPCDTVTGRFSLQGKARSTTIQRNPRPVMNASVEEKVARSAGWLSR